MSETGGGWKFWVAHLGDERVGPIEGLDATLDAVAAKWGGPRRKTQMVRQGLTLGDGEVLLSTEAGRVTLTRDRASDKAKVQDTASDGRSRPFYAHLRLVEADSGGGALVMDVYPSASGLMNTMGAVVTHIAQHLSSYPACMSREACEAREPGWRVQVSRGRGKATINFPPTNDDSAPLVGDDRTFVVGDKNYFAIVNISDAPFQSAPNPKPVQIGFERR